MNSPRHPGITLKINHPLVGRHLNSLKIWYRYHVVLKYFDINTIWPNSTIFKIILNRSLWCLLVQREISWTNQQLQKSGLGLMARGQQLVRQRKIQGNIDAAIETMTLCLPGEFNPLDPESAVDGLIALIYPNKMSCLLWGKFKIAIFKKYYELTLRRAWWLNVIWQMFNRQMHKCIKIWDFHCTHRRNIIMIMLRTTAMK